MTLTAWLPLATICLLGAMSPGPSLAIVLKNTLAGGRPEGVKTAIGHGIGVGLYAFVTAVGLAVVITGSPRLFLIVQCLGAVFLAYLGFKSLVGTTGLRDAARTEGGSLQKMYGFRSGFLSAFLNPKLAIFFAALFSQFVSVETQLVEKMIMALTAAGIDVVWYLLVAMLLSHSRVLGILRSRAELLDKIFGLLLVLLALRLLSVLF